MLVYMVQITEYFCIVIVNWCWCSVEEPSPVEVHCPVEVEVETGAGCSLPLPHPCPLTTHPRESAVMLEYIRNNEMHNNDPKKFRLVACC